MTETRVRAALQDLADTVPATDLVGGRWEEAVRRRRLRNGATVLASALAVATVIVGVNVSNDKDTSNPAPSSPTQDVTPDAPDAFIAGHPVYLSPDLADEKILPAYEGPLPSRITGAGNVTDLDRAVYAAATPGSGVPLLVTLVGRDGTGYPLEVPSRYALPVDENGALPFTHTSLSPSGGLLTLVTRTGFAVYDIGRHKWSSVNYPGTVAERLHFAWVPNAPSDDPKIGDSSGTHLGAPPSVPKHGFPLGDSWGPQRPSPNGSQLAGDWFTTSITEVDAGYTNPEAIAVSGPSPALLVVNGRGRLKGCCAVAGWLDEDWVVYQSRSAAVVRLVAWNIRNGQFMRVASLPNSTFAGEGVTSYATLGLG
jgi:hypothetical protein